ncbi:hypothetical protein, partial [Pseudodesulfovibrio sp.]|uniref:hypothetical protein n=1 Tax=Pseudodesulfovibrio sp. TaxID=2035812 RepID=UPI00261270BA
DGKKAGSDGAKGIPGAKPGFDMKEAVLLAENDTGTASDVGGGAGPKREDADLQIPEGQDEVYDDSRYRGKVNNMETETQQPDQLGKSEGGKTGAEPPEEDQLEGYLGSLGQREASGKYNTKNSLGYLGKYQMGPATLTDTGYMKGGKWTGKDGIHSEKDFLNSPEVQEKAIRDLTEKQWSYAKEKGLDKYVGETINGIEITKSGIIAAVHLKGAGGAKPFFETGGKDDPTDAYGTHVSEYVKKMGGFEIRFPAKDNTREGEK